MTNDQAFARARDLSRKAGEAMAAFDEFVDSRAGVWDEASRERAAELESHVTSIAVEWVAHSAQRKASR